METPGRSYSSMPRWEAEARKTPDVDIDQSDLIETSLIFLDYFDIYKIVYKLVCVRLIWY